MVLRCLWYKRRVGQIAGDLTSVRRGALTLERPDAAAQTVRNPDCRKGGDIDLNLNRKKYVMHLEVAETEFFTERNIACVLSAGE